MSCTPRNPCTPLPLGIEPLPSVVDNFVASFFGEIEKIQSTDGTFVWVLPCDMEAGLASNPRLPNEGVGCYLLRLLESGISGFTGAQGAPGAPGAVGPQGSAAFAVTSLSFVQPALAGTVSVTLTSNGTTSFVSWVQEGSEVFIRTAGYYTVLSISGNVALLQLDSLIASPGATIASGVATVPSGVVGASGSPGAAGAAGVAGASGDFYHFVFRSGVSRPLTPSGNGTPSGWLDVAPTPAPGEFLWVSAVRQTAAFVSSGVWSVPFTVGVGAGDVMMNGSSFEDDIPVFTSSSSTIRDSGIKISDINPVGLQEMWIPAQEMKALTTDGAVPGQVEVTPGNPEIVHIGFDPTTQQYAQFIIAMPKRWDEGTVVAQFYWSHPATTVNFGVVWGLAAVSAGDLDLIGVAYGTTQQIVDTGGVTNDLRVSAAIPALTVSGPPLAGDLTFFQVSRLVADGGDNMAVVARLIGVKLSYVSATPTDA